MHKDLEETVESTHAIQIKKYALCIYFYNIKEELERYEDEQVQVQISLNSKVPSCEIHLLTEKTTILAANDDKLSSSLAKSPDCLFIAVFH